MSNSKYIFIFAPNNSGTTVLSQYLKGQTLGYLPTFGNFEGQMIPEVKSMMRSQPWNPEQKMDWQYIKRVWDDYCRRNGSSVFIEGSPPNFLRCSEIRKVFDDVAQYIAFISSPYMQIASSLYNHKARNIISLLAATNEWLGKLRLRLPGL